MIEARTGRVQCYWMIELSDKVKCDASSFEVEWLRLSPDGCHYCWILQTTAMVDAGCCAWSAGEGGIRKPEKGASRTADLRVVRFGRPRQGRIFTAGPRLKASWSILSSQPEQAISCWRRRPGTTAILLSFWWCAKRAAGEAAPLGGPSAGSSALTDEWRAYSILGIGVDKGPFLCHTTDGSWHMFGFRNRRNAQSARPTPLRRSHSERPARRRPDILASRLMVPKR